jgi:hypothetical protein
MICLDPVPAMGRAGVDAAYVERADENEMGVPIADGRLACLTGEDARCGEEGIRT